MALVTPALSLTTVEVTEDKYAVTIDAINEITLNNPTNGVYDLGAAILGGLRYFEIEDTKLYASGTQNPNPKTLVQSTLFPLCER